MKTLPFIFLLIVFSSTGPVSAQAQKPPPKERTATQEETTKAKPKTKFFGKKQVRFLNAAIPLVGGIQKLSQNGIQYDLPDAVAGGGVVGAADSGRSLRIMCCCWWSAEANSFLRPPAGRPQTFASCLRKRAPAWAASMSGLDLLGESDQEDYAEAPALAQGAPFPPSPEYLPVRRCHSPTTCATFHLPTAFTPTPPLRTFQLRRPPRRSTVRHP